MNRYKVTGLCESEDGSRFVLGRVVVEAENESGAEHKAWEELWDARLTSASCLFVARIEELEAGVPMDCHICGNGFETDESGVSHHLSDEDEGIDGYDLDGDHVPYYLDESEE